MENEDWQEVRNSAGENTLKKNFKPAWDFEKNKELIGELLEKKPDVGKYKKTVYTIKTDAGVLETMWGGAAIDSRLKEVPLRSIIKVIFNGIKLNRNTGKYFKDFSVYVKPTTVKKDVSVEAEFIPEPQKINEDDLKF